MTRRIVVDLSHWNWPVGQPVNLQRLVDLGAEGFIFKATQGTWYVDDRFKESVDQAKLLRVPYSLYHFLDPIQDGMQDGNEQYEFFMDETEGYRSLSPNGLDIEWQGDLTAYAYGALVIDFLDNPGEWLAYSNLNFLNNILAAVSNDIAALADIWLAWPSQYAKDPVYPSRYAKSKLKLWQKSWDWYGVDMSEVMDEAWWQENFVMEPPSVPHSVAIDVPAGADVIVVTLNRRG